MQRFCNAVNFYQFSSFFARMSFKVSGLVVVVKILIGTDLILLLILFVFLFLLGRPLQKSLRLRHFKFDRDEILQDCSSRKYALIDRDRFLIRRHFCTMVAMTSFTQKSAAKW